MNRSGSISRSTLSGRTSMPQTSASLLERLRDRADSEAWTRMVSLYSPMIRTWSGRYRLAGSDVDVISQAVLRSVVANLSRLQHNSRAGAFRNWLRVITVNSLRQKLRADRKRLDCPGGHVLLKSLSELQDPESDLSRLWNRIHDTHVLRTLLTWAESEFEAKTWQAFRRQVLEEASPRIVAAQLDMTVN